LSTGDYLPSQLVKLGFSAYLAAALQTYPFIVQIFTSLLTSNSSRVQERLLRVVEELAAQQERIESSIPDKRYYESEDFYSLLGLVIERLQTTHDKEKLRMFGDALANSGSSEFQVDDKDNYIRILRDLSITDLRVLNDERLKGWLPHTHFVDYDPEILSSLARLQGMGLVTETLKVKPSSGGRTGSERMDAEILVRELLTNPPKKSYSLSPFGGRFLRFIASGDAIDSKPTT
jgi:hypothetical protein